MKKDTFLIIGAGVLQKQYFNILKKYDIKIALTDKNINCKNKNNIDYFLHANGSDVESIKKFAEEISKNDKIIGMYCGNDFGLTSVAEIAEIYNLEYASQVSTYNSLDKRRTKKILKLNEILTPEGDSFISMEKALNYYSSNMGQVVIKPANSSGSRGVEIVSEEKSFKKAFTNAKLYSSQIIVEELIHGRHIDVNSLMINSSMYRLGTGERFFSDYPYALTKKGIVPADISDQIEDSLYTALENAANALGIKNGPIKGDFILKGKELYLLEITPRFHGDIYSLHLYGNIYDKSIIEHYFNYVINKTVPRIINNNNYSGYLPIYARPGHVLRVTGLSDAHSSRGVEKIILLKENNFTIKENTNNSSVLGFIIGIGNSYDKLTENLNNSRRKIGFDYAPQR